MGRKINIPINGRLVIFTISGQQLVSSTLRSDNTAIDIAVLPKGFYLILIQRDRTYAVKPLIIQ